MRAPSMKRKIDGNVKKMVLAVRSRCPKRGRGTVWRERGNAYLASRGCRATANYREELTAKLRRPEMKWAELRALEADRGERKQSSVDRQRVRMVGGRGRQSTTRKRISAVRPCGELVKRCVRVIY